MSRSVDRRVQGTSDPKGDLMPKQTNRDAILRAARNLFTSKGFASTTVREIRQEASVTAPVLYYHFGSSWEQSYEYGRGWAW